MNMLKIFQIKRSYIFQYYIIQKSDLDLSYVAKHNKLTTDEVIEIHTQNEYLVYMLGFMPGFPF